MTAYNESIFFKVGLWLAISYSGLAGSPPALQPASQFQRQAVEVGKGMSFVPNVAGDIPLSFQWKLDGRDLPAQTNSNFDIAATSASDEGDYTLAVTNGYGAVLSQPARLWVVPPASRFNKGNLTSAGLRLPYFYLLPTNYNWARKYPLVVWLHGFPADETAIIRPAGAASSMRYLAEGPALKVLASLGRQASDPAILLWPTRRVGDRHWTEDYLRLIAGLLEQFCSGFSVDTNRVYLGAFSEGVHAAWEIAAARPGFFAASIFFDGWAGRAPAALLRSVPIWVFHSATDEVVDVRRSRLLVQALRLEGAATIYTEYASGTHGDAPRTGLTTPAVVDWFTAQRRGAASAHGPLLSITNQIVGLAAPAGARTLAVSGIAEASGHQLASIQWQNETNGKSGSGSGSDFWEATDMALQAGKTNLIVVTATTSESSLLGGSTTFNQSLRVFCPSSQPDHPAEQGPH